MTRDLTGKAKSCPMCGSKRIYLKEPNYDYMFSVEIKCADCGLTGYKNFTKEEKNPIEKTIEYWNTRVPVTVNKDEFDPQNTRVPVTVDSKDFDAHKTVVGKRLDAGFID